MSVKIRPYRGKEGVWEVDIVVRMADGQIVRERRKAPVTGKSAAQRWAQERERYLIQHGPERSAAHETSTTPATGATTKRDEVKKEVPTLAEFGPRLLEGHYLANRLAPATYRVAEENLRLHLGPAIGGRRLDEIGDVDVQKIKAAMASLSTYRVNSVLNTLSTLLKKAIEWKVIPHRPIEIKRLQEPDTDVEFYEDDQLEKIIEAAQGVSLEAHVIMLLGADAGMRRGEIVALQWEYVDLDRKVVTVAFSDYRGQLRPTKGKRVRRVVMTRRLHAALVKCKHERGPFVLTHEDGRRWTGDAVEWRVRQAQSRAGLGSARTIRQERGKSHKLRHTCGSRLAMKGAPTLAIKEILGHRDIATTQRYMHLAPRAMESAIRLLDDADE